MKIKSWTGNEVDARVGMVVKIGDYDVTTILNHDDMRFTELCRVDDGCAFNAMMKDCTMLHCPFVVGDEVEILDLQTGKWHITIIDEEDLEMAKRYGAQFYDWLTKFRHANPDLRDSPEYAP